MTENALQLRAPGDDMVDLASTLWASRWLIVGTAIAGSMVAIAASLLVTPIYRGEAVVVIVGEDSERGLEGMLGELGGLASLAGVNIGGGGSAIDETLAYVQSRELGIRFVRENAMTEALLQAPNLRSVFAPNDPADPAQREREAYRLFDSKVRAVRFDKKTGVLRVGMDWPDAGHAAEWANRYVALANSELRRRALERYEARRKFLENKLAQTSQVELRSAAGKLLDSQLRMAMVASSRDDFALKMIDPAVPPLKRERISPRRPVYATFGLLMGLTLAGIFVLVRKRRAN